MHGVYMKLGPKLGPFPLFDFNVPNFLVLLQAIIAIESRSRYN